MTFLKRIDKKYWYIIWSIIGIIAIGYSLYLDEQVAGEANNGSYIILDDNVYDKYDVDGK
jgi:hypothetical protein